MPYALYRRHARLAGVYSLAELLAGGWIGRGRAPSLPTTDRPSRDDAPSQRKDGGHFRDPAGPKPLTARSIGRPLKAVRNEP